MYIPRKLLISLAASCAMAGGLAAKTGTPSRADSHFMGKAAQGTRAEVELGRLATQNGSSDQVKQFAQRMISEHSKANSQLVNIAARQGVSLPDKVDRKDQKEYDHLAGLNGHKFDQAYMKYMVKDHKKDAKEFKHEAEHGKNADVQHFASETEPALQQHLRLAQQTKSELK